MAIRQRVAVFIFQPRMTRMTRMGMFFPYHPRDPRFLPQNLRSFLIVTSISMTKVAAAL
jgi:hypothetical protein